MLGILFDSDLRFERLIPYLFTSHFFLMFSFIQNRFYFYGVALALTVFSLLTPWIFGVNLGIDMTGGIQIEYSVEGGDSSKAEALAKTSASEVEKTLQVNGKSVINGISIYGIAGTSSFVVEAGFIKGEGSTEASIQEAKAQFTKLLGEKLTSAQGMKITQSRYVNVGESFGAYIKKSGYITLSLAIIMIALYIAYAFRGSIPGMASWPFAAVTGISLLHDVIVAFGLYVASSYFFPEFKIDTFFITAMLTILGYSINDTIVVMDRIRSNLSESEGKK